MWTDKKACICFNSTLVQLKVNGDGLRCLISPSFNSTLVQLKVHPIHLQAYS